MCFSITSKKHMWTLINIVGMMVGGLNPLREIVASGARHVKTVNGRRSQKTVGAAKHRYRLRWSSGIWVDHPTEVVISLTRPALARVGAPGYPRVLRCPRLTRVLNVQSRACQGVATCVRRCNSDYRTLEEPPTLVQGGRGDVHMSEVLP